jgi:hypothetical protein
MFSIRAAVEGKRRKETNEVLRKANLMALRTYRRSVASTNPRK